MRARRTHRSKYTIATGAAAGLLLLAACADGPSAPPQQAPPAAARAQRGSNPNESTSSGKGSASVQVVEMVVNNAWTRGFKLPNGHWILFPARSICDLGTSGYGPGTWDLPCTPHQGTVTILATVRTDAAGHPVVDFSPRLRFNPAAAAVTLTMKDAYVSQTDRAILYCPDAGPCVDESLTDPSLVTYSEAGGNYYKRRIKHFSGYNIASGRSVATASLE
jgi:hypothetical protein